MPKPSPKPKTKPKSAHRPVSPIVYMLIPLAFAAGLAGGYLLWGMGSSSGSGQAEISTEGDPSLGPEDAPVTVIEFADYQCGWCRKWFSESFDILRADYPTQVRFVYRDYAVLTAESIPAAQAAHCAGEQDAFWDYQRSLFSGEYTLGRSAYLEIAASLSLDLQPFTDCLDSGKYADEVQEDTLDGSRAGVTGPPAFFINGRFVPGYLPYDQFKAIIDEELAATG